MQVMKHLVPIWDGVLNFSVTKHKPPKEVGIWNKADQPCKDQEIEDIAEFAKSFTTWWSDLQQAAHVKVGSLLPVTIGINWKRWERVDLSWFCWHSLGGEQPAVRAALLNGSQWLKMLLRSCDKSRGCLWSKKYENTMCPKIHFQSQGHQNMYQSKHLRYTIVPSADRNFPQTSWTTHRTVDQNLIYLQLIRGAQFSVHSVLSVVSINTLSLWWELTGSDVRAKFSQSLNWAL